MKKWSSEEVREFARRILSSYFCENDVELLISTFADDIIWLGGGKMQKAEGRDAVAAWFREGKDELSSCNMFDEQYEVMEMGAGLWLCEGVSELESREGTGVYIRTQQRITFIFRERVRRWRPFISTTPCRLVKYKRMNCFRRNQESVLIWSWRGSCADVSRNTYSRPGS